MSRTMPNEVCLCPNLARPVPRVHPGSCMNCYICSAFFTPRLSNTPLDQTEPPQASNRPSVTSSAALLCFHADMPPPQAIPVPLKLHQMPPERRTWSNVLRHPTASSSLNVPHAIHPLPYTPIPIHQSSLLPSIQALTLFPLPASCTRRKPA